MRLCFKNWLSRLGNEGPQTKIGLGARNGCLEIDSDAEAASEGSGDISKEAGMNWLGKQDDNGGVLFSNGLRSKLTCNM